jgi:ribosome-associated toxin RatA of RatAB toxin-antitoxin module
MEAKLDFDIKGIKTSFTTRNSICENRFIEMKLVDGPFKFLDGKWEFEEVNGKTIVTLYINYEPKNKIIEYAVGKSLEKISGILVKSFVEESMK